MCVCVCARARACEPSNGPAVCTAVSLKGNTMQNPAVCILDHLPFMDNVQVMPQQVCFLEASRPLQPCCVHPFLVSNASTSIQSAEESEHPNRVPTPCRPPHLKYLLHKPQGRCKRALCFHPPGRLARFLLSHGPHLQNPAAEQVLCTVLSTEAPKWLLVTVQG